MRDYLANEIRNVAVLGHSGAGKSTVIEACMEADRPEVARRIAALLKSGEDADFAYRIVYKQLGHIWIHESGADTVSGASAEEGRNRSFSGLIRIPIHGLREGGRSPGRQSRQVHPADARPAQGRPQAAAAVRHSDDCRNRIGDHNRGGRQQSRQS